MKVWITRDVGMKDVVELWLECLPKFTGKTWNDPDGAQRFMSDDFCMSAFGKVPDEGGVLEVELKVVEVKEVVDEKKEAKTLARRLAERKNIDKAQSTYLVGSEHDLIIKALEQFAQNEGKR